MKTIKILLLFFLLNGCNKSRIPSEYSGDWSLSNIYHNGIDILKEYRDSYFLSNILVIDSRGKFLIESQNDDKKNIIGDIYYNKKNNSLIIENSSESKLNGKYKIQIKINEDEKFKSIFLTLKSESSVLIAEKHITTIRL